MTPLVDHYGTAKHCSYGLVCKNVAILFKESELDLNAQHFEEAWQPVIFRFT